MHAQSHKTCARTHKDTNTRTHGHAHTRTQVFLHVVDVASIQSVREFAQKFLQTHPKVVAKYKYP